MITGIIGVGVVEVELPDSCQLYCDCLFEYDCINECCVIGEELIYCCSYSGCFVGDVCWFDMGAKGECSGG